MAAIAASLATSGTSKSGSPIDRLIGSFIFAARSKSLRIPEASTPCARRELKSEGERIRGVAESLNSGVVESGVYSTTLPPDHTTTYFLPFAGAAAAPAAA